MQTSLQTTGDDYAALFRGGDERRLKAMLLGMDVLKLTDGGVEQEDHAFGQELTGVTPDHPVRIELPKAAGLALRAIIGLQEGVIIGGNLDAPGGKYNAAAAADMIRRLFNPEMFCNGENFRFFTPGHGPISWFHISNDGLVRTLAGYLAQSGPASSTKAPIPMPLDVVVDGNGVALITVTLETSQMHHLRIDSRGRGVGHKRIVLSSPAGARLLPLKLADAIFDPTAAQVAVHTFGQMGNYPASRMIADVDAAIVTDRGELLVSTTKRGRSFLTLSDGLTEGDEDVIELPVVGRVVHTWHTDSGERFALIHTCGTQYIPVRIPSSTIR